MSDDMKIIPMMQQSNMFTTEVRGQQHTFYITGPIGQPEEYIELCNTLRTCSPQDEVIIRLNSRGGLVSSERMIVNAVRESQATVRGFIEYDCMSAATGIFLACHIHGWAEHIQFMAHCSWWGAIGKNPDIKSQTEFGLRQMEEEIEATYTGLLSPEEIIQCNEGKEFWFGAKELEERMGSYYEYLESQGCGDSECPGCSAEPEEMETVDLLIEKAVESGVNKALDKLMKKYSLVEKEKVPSKKTAKALEQAKVIKEAHKDVDEKLKGVEE